MTQEMCSIQNKSHLYGTKLMVKDKVPYITPL